MECSQWHIEPLQAIPAQTRQATHCAASPGNGVSGLQGAAEEGQEAEHRPRAARQHDVPGPGPAPAHKTHAGHHQGPSSAPQPRGRAHGRPCTPRIRAPKTHAPSAVALHATKISTFAVAVGPPAGKSTAGSGDPCSSGGVRAHSPCRHGIAEEGRGGHCQVCGRAGRPGCRCLVADGWVWRARWAEVCVFELIRHVILYAPVPPKPRFEAFGSGKRWTAVDVKKTHFVFSQVEACRLF